MWIIAAMPLWIVSFGLTFPLFVCILKNDDPSDFLVRMSWFGIGISMVGIMFIIAAMVSS